MPHYRSQAVKERELAKPNFPYSRHSCVRIYIYIGRVHISRFSLPIFSSSLGSSTVSFYIHIRALKRVFIVPLSRALRAYYSPTAAAAARRREVRQHAAIVSLFLSSFSVLIILEISFGQSERWREEGSL